MFHIDRFYYRFVGPFGQIEQGRGCAARTRPIDTAQGAEIRLPELKGTAIQHYGATQKVFFPKSSASRAIFALGEEVVVQVHVAEFQDTILCDNEFLVHNLTNNYEWTVFMQK